MQHTRRRFLKAALAASAVPVLIPGSAFGANERVTLALVGAGGRGRWLVREAFGKLPEARVVAACDVDADMLAKGVADTNKVYGDTACKGYRDFREVMARGDIDGVIVATPDHWHALNGIAAAKAGKHVYGEKPIANTIGESKALRDAVKKAGIVFQTGSMERSRPAARYCCEVVRNGFIGRLKTIRINLPTDQGHHNKVREQTAVPAQEAPPSHLDWSLWLGHTPEIPYRPGIHPGQWRFIRSFGCGEMSDRGAHVIDIGQLGGGFDGTGPVAVEARGWDAPHGQYDTPMGFEFENVYANGVKMVGGTAGSPRGVRFEGDEGWIFMRIHEGTLEASDPKLLELDPETFKVKLGRAQSHWQNFIDAIKGRAPAFADAEVGHRSCTACLVNMMAMQLSRKLTWDPAGETFTGDAEANRLTMPPMRDPWSPV